MERLEGTERRVNEGKRKRLRARNENGKVEERRKGFREMERMQ